MLKFLARLVASKLTLNSSSLHINPTCLKGACQWIDDLRLPIFEVKTDPPSPILVFPLKIQIGSN